jgi:hypothetical protein
MRTPEEREGSWTATSMWAGFRSTITRRWALGVVATFQDVCGGQDDADGGQGGKGEEGHRLGVGRDVAEGAEAGVAGQPADYGSRRSQPRFPC